MVGIPETFTKLSPTLANYDFVDIAAGTGFVNFYAGKTVDLYLLSNNTFYADSVSTGQSAVLTYGGAPIVMFDIDFDVTLNRPLDLQGLGIVNVPISIYCAFTGTVNIVCYPLVTLRKWDGASETDVCNNQGTSLTVASGTNGSTYFKMDAVDLTIPLTHFKKGETLRLTIQLYANYTTNSGKNHTVAFGLDPMNRTTDGLLSWDTTGAVPSKLVFQCPVRLNI